MPTYILSRFYLCLYGSLITQSLSKEFNGLSCMLQSDGAHSLNQVMQHLARHNILSDNQHGFRKKSSCESQLILTIQDLASSLEYGEQIDAVVLDFSEAFDKVPNQRLLLKLQRFGSEVIFYHGLRAS